MKISNIISKIFSLLSIFLMLSVIAISFFRPFMPWDSWAYHFPFSAQLFQINDYFQSFSLDQILQDRYEGFPRIAEFLQGVLWLLTGSISSMALINSIPLVFFIYCATRYGHANFPILVFGILAIPLIAVHALSTYIDLFMSVALSFQFLAAVILHKLFENKSPEKKRFNKWLIIYTLAAAVSGNTKMWAPIISSAISIILFASIAKKSKNISSFNILLRIHVTLIISVILCCGSLIKNTITYKNPVYPISISVPILNLSLNGPETEYKNYPGYADSYGVLSRPIYFLLSITEWDWSIRGVEPLYTLETGPGDRPKRYSPARTGGWWGLTILISIFLTSGMWLIATFTKFGHGRISTFPLKLFCLLTLLTSFMPQSHELRYFLYWPILLIFNLAYLTKYLYSNRLISVLITSLYISMFLYSLFILRGETLKSLLTYKTQSELIGVPQTAEEIVAAKKLGGICLGSSYNPNQFKYSSVLQGGIYFIEQGWIQCVKYPEFKK